MAVTPLAGRWIVVNEDYGGGTWPHWWHVTTSDRIDWAEGYAGGFDDTYPATLAGWYRLLRAPDTSAIDRAAAPGWPEPLLLGAAGGLLLGLFRFNRRRPFR